MRSIIVFVVSLTITILYTSWQMLFRPSLRCYSSARKNTGCLCLPIHFSGNLLSICVFHLSWCHLLLGSLSCLGLIRLWLVWPCLLEVICKIPRYTLENVFVWGWWLPRWKHPLTILTPRAGCHKKNCSTTEKGRCWPNKVVDWKIVLCLKEVVWT